jgi:Ribbon-helix-helix protein, copG family
MDVRPAVETVKTQLAAAAALGDDSTQRTAEALVVAADPAVRLALLNAVTAAADEITVGLLDLPRPPTIDVRLDADEIRIEVRTVAPVEVPVEVSDDDNTARVSLRLPEALKAQIDAAARRSGVSVNTWLIRAAQQALSADTAAIDQPAGLGRHGQRFSGWVNG